METRGRKKARLNPEREKEPRPFVYKGTFGVGRGSYQKQADDAFTSKMKFGAGRDRNPEQPADTPEETKSEANRDGIKRR
jgi:hypothetical protein